MHSLTHSLIYLYKILKDTIQTDLQEVQMVIATLVLSGYCCS